MDASQAFHEAPSQRDIAIFCESEGPSESEKSASECTGAEWCSIAGENENKQFWVFTDVCTGPWMAEDGPLKRSIMEVANIKSIVYEEQFVNAFRLDDAIMLFGPFDLVVSFGAWPNVLTGEICQNVCSDSPEPTHEERARIQRNQKRVFNFPLEFLAVYSHLDPTTQTLIFVLH